MTNTMRTDGIRVPRNAARVTAASGLLALLAALPTGCGKVYEVLRSPGAGGTDVDGGMGVGGQHPDAGTPGAGGAPADKAVDAGEYAGSDPHRGERRRLVAAYCAQLARETCLIPPPGYPVPLPVGDQECRGKSEQAGFARTQLGCWDEWAAVATCAANATVPCPCPEGRTDLCYFPSLTHVGTTLNGTKVFNPCQVQQDALDACVELKTRKGQIDGNRTTCYWRGNDGCSVHCDPPSNQPNVVFDATCDGPPGGPFVCACAANGVSVGAPSPEYGDHFANDCEDMARQMANGVCVGALDCCVNTVGENGTPGYEICMCSAVPPPNFATCDEYAAQWNTGKVVSICPGYRTP